MNQVGAWLEQVRSMDICHFCLAADWSWLHTMLRRGRLEHLRLVGFDIDNPMPVELATALIHTCKVRWVGRGK